MFLGDRIMLACNPWRLLQWSHRNLPWAFCFYVMPYRSVCALIQAYLLILIYVKVQLRKELFSGIPNLTIYPINIPLHKPSISMQRSSDSSNNKTNKQTKRILKIYIYTHTCGHTFTPACIQRQNRQPRNWVSVTLSSQFPCYTLEPVTTPNFRETRHWIHTKRDSTDEQNGLTFAEQSSKHLCMWPTEHILLYYRVNKV